MKIRVINKSSRELPEELADACMQLTITDVNNVADEYNLKIVEYEKIFDDGELLEVIYTIGDIK